MGSRSKIDLAYIAGFLDGDGSLMIQIKNRNDTKLGHRFMLTICFYQKSDHEKPLFWMRQILGIGYISRRKDRITELRINGFRQVNEIIKKLIPFIKFKKKQAKAIYKASNLLISKNIRKLTKNEKKELVDYILIMHKENYITKSKRSRNELFKILDLTP